jgi:hypothetical protein
VGRAPGAHGLDLPAFEGQPGLEPFLDKIIVEGLAILDDAHPNRVGARTSS